MSTEKSTSQKVVRLLATWFGCGLSPKAPGTFGTLGAIPLCWLLFQVTTPLGYMLSTLIFSIAAIFVAHFHEATSGEHDASEVVIDEVAGYLVAMAWMPFTWSYVVAAFFIFRLFDIWKPYPISYVDRQVKGGVGAVGDDLLAGILTNIVLQILLQRGIF